MAQSFKFKNKIYYFRFTALPAGIVPGVVNISQMVMTKLPSPPPLPPSLQYTALNSNNDDFPLLPGIYMFFNFYYYYYFYLFFFTYN